MDKKQSIISDFNSVLQSRQDPNTTPKQKIVARQLDDTKEPTLLIHTSGQNTVWEISIREAASDNTILSEMDKSDVDLVKWIYKNDCDIERYNYKS